MFMLKATFPKSATQGYLEQVTKVAVLLLAAWKQAARAKAPPISVIRRGSG